MTRAAVDDAVQEGDLLLLREPVRRYLARTVRDEQELDDLVQETLLRVWEVRGRVGRSAAGAYAVATARNLVQSRSRSQQLHARHAHRLHEPDIVDGPEVDALRQEERLAAAEVARTLAPDDLDLLATPPRAVEDRTPRRRSQLARARSRARVDYLLHLRRLTLPTSRCRPVLESLSAGDRRQQERAGAAQHLLACGVCAASAPALVARERRLFGLVALPVLVLLELLRQAFRQAPRTSTAVTAGAATAAVAAAFVLGSPGERPAATVQGGPPASAAAPSAAASTAPSAAPSNAPSALPPAAPAAPPLPAVLDADTGLDPALLRRPGTPVVARGVLVLSVPADEGLWVGPDDAVKVFVVLAGDRESAVVVRPGDRVSFTGTVAALDGGAAAGVDPAEDLARLTSAGGYITVPEGTLTVDR